MFYCKFYFTCDRSLSMIGLKVKTHNIQAANYNTCNLQPIAAYRPIDGSSPLSGISRLQTERVPDDRHHGRGSAHFLATFIAVVIGT